MDLLKGWFMNKVNYYFSNDVCIAGLLRFVLKTPSSVEEIPCPRMGSQDLSANSSKFSFNPD